jgi:hypothetical protein
MKRLFKTNQRKKQLSRQQKKMTARRLSHFNQMLSEPVPQQENWLSSQR